MQSSITRVFDLWSDGPEPISTIRDIPIDDFSDHILNEIIDMSFSYDETLCLLDFIARKAQKLATIPRTVSETDASLH